MKIHRIAAAAVSTLVLAAGANAAGLQDRPMSRMSQDEVMTYAISPDSGRPEAVAWHNRINSPAASQASQASPMRQGSSAPATSANASSAAATYGYSNVPTDSAVAVSSSPAASHRMAASPAVQAPRAGGRLGAASDEALPMTEVYSPDSGRPEAVGANTRVRQIEAGRMAAAQPRADQVSAVSGSGLSAEDATLAETEAWLDGAPADDSLAHASLTDEPLTDAEVAYISENLRPDAVIVMDGQQYYVYWEQSPDAGTAQ